MVRCLIFLLCGCLGLWGFAQDQNLEGRLLAEDTGLPVENALVYIDGTTIGFVSDENGLFVLEGLSLPVRLEVSHLNFDPKSVVIDGKSNLPVEIRLKPKTVQLDAVMILSRNTRIDYVREFHSWFIGHDMWGKRARLLNDDALLFFEEKQGGFRASATEPLIIESQGLGYTIHADLKNFVMIDDKKGEPYCSFVARYHFTPKDAEKYEKHRARAFFNSAEHFLRSVYEMNTMSNGYLITELVDGEEQSGVVGSELLDGYLRDYQSDIKIIEGLKGRKFYVSFHANIDGYPVDLEVDPPKKNNQASLVEFKQDKIFLRSDGTTPNIDVEFSGSLAGKKVGAMVPRDYRPLFSPKQKAKQSTVPSRLTRNKTSGM